MEENLNQNISQTIPSPIEPAVVAPIPSINQPPFGSWWKVGGLVLGGVILAGGLFFAGYQYSQKQKTTVAYPTIIPTPTPSPINQTTPSPTSTVGPTANWKTIRSERCGFNISYPLTWEANETQLIPGSDNPKYRYGCVGIKAPDFRIIPPGEREGFGISITRTTKGASFNQIIINSLDDYIKATESMTQPTIKVANLQDKNYGNIQGKYYEFSARDITASFIFTSSDYLYEINWSKTYNGVYKNQTSQILSTFRFLE